MLRIMGVSVTEVRTAAGIINRASVPFRLKEREHASMNAGMKAGMHVSAHASSRVHNGHP